MMSMHDTGRTSVAPAGDKLQNAGRLRGTVDRLQAAACGSLELDTSIDQSFQCLSAALTGRGLAGLPVREGARWSTEVSTTIDLLSADYNFSVGQRDGICWAWIQPNDDWQPGEFEARHDHPAGSGLVVAYTAALALTSAILILYAQRLEIRIAPQ
jgi:hypothetical protein